MTRLWRNGQWIELLDSAIAPTDRGLMHGLGLFETMLAIGGKPVFAKRHLARLARNCQRLGWEPEIPDIREIMSGVTGGRSRIRLTITGGSGRANDLSLGSDHGFLITVTPAAEPPAMTTANLSPFVRNERSALVGLKCASYAENLVALDHARRLGFEETVFCNSTGHLCEAATANLFLVQNGNLLTPSLESGCLPGITREVVIGLAKQLGISCSERDLTAAEIHSAGELFLTSSIRGVMGLSRFEDRMFALGPVTAALRGAWNQAVLREIAG
jgi:branched-subunit amino acid aminotransferase/4-amino-4-deoxychorismate lyase